ncbi:unnamed protein product [Didymodactylos carnosus]|uniref:FLYWCH-type domain-containing protein n=1 Tax=Didymodactylos carnosus TaxID=1234261 RepID=A0A814AVR8_9BILA|nr:unnamed protein product [Didymodactylos carnosus]CAF0968701.1 unnamed protein product [Didymodactylos carnosus]CAF3697962.1 unnamed protein product [Didymodactylos carnosus]CAF3740335.1 unnamed protein product [Didymodactylos carnosus]
MDLIRTITDKGTPAISFDSNFYRLHFVNKSLTERWICTKFKCYCTILLDQDQTKILSINGRHNHSQQQTRKSSSKIDNLKIKIQQLEKRCQMYEQQLDDRDKKLTELTEENEQLKQKWEQMITNLIKVEQ